MKGYEIPNSMTFQSCWLRTRWPVEFEWKSGQGMDVVYEYEIWEIQDVQDTWAPYFRRNISAKIQPTLHMSTGVAYVDCKRTSGARYQSVTT